VWRSRTSGSRKSRVRAWGRAVEDDRASASTSSTVWKSRWHWAAEDRRRGGGPGADIDLTDSVSESGCRGAGGAGL
jgi:hypothetical protein